MLQLDCAITGSDIIEIRWYFSHSNNSLFNSTLLTNSTKHQLLPHTEGGTSGLQLTIHRLTEAEDTGSYWCQGIVPDGSLTTSDTFELRAEEEYMFFSFPCRTILRRSNPSCASVIQLPTVPPPTTLTQTTPPHTTLQPTPLHTPIPVTNNPETTPFATTIDVTQYTPPFLVSDSQLILYVVLGLVGFLGVICMALGVVIVLLCRRRCQENSLNGELMI